MTLGDMPKLQVSHTRRAVLVVAALVLLLAACSEGNGDVPCLPQDVEKCTCDDGTTGYFVCDPEGGSGPGYGPCICDLDASPYLPVAPDASPDEGTDGEEGDAGDGGLQFMSACSVAPGAPQCPPGTTCYDFPAKGDHCSKPCTIDSDCPPPSPGCNMQGECKAP
jgi:hypothetical protein